MKQMYHEMCRMAATSPTPATIWRNAEYFDRQLTCVRKFAIGYRHHGMRCRASHLNTCRRVVRCGYTLTECRKTYDSTELSRSMSSITLTKSIFVHSNRRVARAGSPGLQGNKKLADLDSCSLKLLVTPSPRLGGRGCPSAGYRGGAARGSFHQ